MAISGLFAFNTTMCIVKNRNFFSKDLNDVNFHVGYQDFFSLERFGFLRKLVEMATADGCQSREPHAKKLWHITLMNERWYVLHCGWENLPP